MDLMDIFSSNPMKILALMGNVFQLLNFLLLKTFQRFLFNC